MKKEIYFSIALLPIFLFLLTSDAFASEGKIHLSNQDGSDAECYALSVLMPSLDYEILMTCRNISYPGDVNQFNYVAWAEPSDGGNPERLGTLGVGKIRFDSEKPFNRIFVTREGSNRPRTPSANSVMSGNVQEISELSGGQTTTPTQRTASTPTASPAAAAQAPSLISRIFQPGRIIVFGGVLLLLVLVFILTRR